MLFRMLPICLLAVALTGEAHSMKQRKIQQAETNLPSNTLPVWRECPSEDPLSPGIMLCDGPQDGISVLASRVIEDLLRQGVTDLRLLCRLEENVRASERICFPQGDSHLRSYSDQSDIVPILDSLAENWAKRGSHERANQLYQHAFNLLEELGSPQDTFSYLNQIVILQKWASERLMYGDRKRAKELAIQQANLGRAVLAAADLEANRKNVILSVRQVMYFQAEIFSELGLEEEAQKLHKEADELQ